MGLTPSSAQKTECLERLTEPPDLVEADEGAAEDVEGQEDVGAAFVAHAQAPEAVQPGVRAFHHPAVTPEALAVVHASPGDTGPDATDAALLAAAPVVVALVRVQLVRPSSRSAAASVAHWWNGIQRWRQHAAVVLVGRSDQHAKGCASGIDCDVAFAPWPATIRWVWPGSSTPLFAWTDALSRAARRQSSCPAACRRSSSTWCKAAQTPASCQSRRRRQQLMPEPHPISAGSISHGRPDFSTNRIPVRAARSDRRGRPPFGFGASGGKSGAIAAHRSSGTRGRAMLPITRRNRFS